MKKLLFLSILLTGCASTSDIESLQSQIVVLDSRISNVAQDAQVAKEAAIQAGVKANEASAAANRAAQYAQEVNSKLDRLFRKTQLK